ncbi:MAG: PDZ domain-containing protein [Oscillospiraceae bacterium]|nr:PDZ domain-containing protein [Oscillospiraceae bacterium]
MKKLTKYTAFLLLCALSLPAKVFARELIPVGKVVGLELQDDTVTIAAFDENLGAAAKAAGVSVGDQIIRIDGSEIRTSEDVRTALERSDGTVELSVCRDGKEKQYSLTPEITASGPKLGLYLRQGVTGIGTVTYYDPDTGSFGTLGHGVNDSDGNLLNLVRGYAYDARVLTVRKGRAGDPGQLMGTVDGASPIGVLSANTERGVFGTTQEGWQGEAITVAGADEIKTGAAVIRSTVSGDTVREYSVEILKIYPKSKQNGRNLLLRVTDPALLEATGGIVQGMSGSPIIQDGKLIGAVTHVLVNDPTTGYGIFIENMLDAAA